jgi:Skp family chaperone for outer membrane proteins
MEVRLVNKSIAALAGGIIVTALGWQALAQTPPPGTRPPGNQPAPPPTTNTAAAPTMAGTKVGVVNMNKVLKNFNKAQQLNNHIASQVNAFGQQITAKREQMEKLKAEMAKSVNPTEVENMRKQAVQIEREMQDLDAEARKQISNQQNSIATSIYKDIEGVIQRVAVANGFDIVLSFPDATTDTEMYSQPNVVRKLASQAAIPIYFKPHVDLSDAVVQTLNATFPVAAAPPATNPGAPQIIPTAGTNQPQPKK